ncbi:hypothetical protein XELAEV_18019048mg [Xenopus laevis]|uniref:Uncharacterized protein n=1 Tax=Xenopus laevis TaxID=8355 RepID=A0A974DEA9_XENLA|nr:hypothetical protein XELAEV_18019048mg [Xenopus laevis]
MQIPPLVLIRYLNLLQPSHPSFYTILPLCMIHRLLFYRMCKWNAFCQYSSPPSLFLVHSPYILITHL